MAAFISAWQFHVTKDEGRNDFLPSVSVLKPLHGAEPQLYENLASFCRQDYGDYEVLLAVDSSEDAAIPTVHQLIRDFPAASIRLFIGTEARGSNNKVEKLCRLAREAHHDLLVVSDSDIRADRDYLRRVAAVFGDTRVGAATCFYRGIARRNVWSELEALHVSTDFLPGAFVARVLGVKFTFGATMAVTRKAIQDIGGFEALLDSAADDRELGHRIAERGYKVEVTRSVVETQCSSGSWRDFFRHQVRWGVVTRQSELAGYLGYVFAQGLPWAVAAAAMAPSSRITVGFLAAYLVLRTVMALVVGDWVLGDRLVRKRWWMLPVHDAIGFLVWFVSLWVNRVYWQGEEYESRQGRLSRV